MIKTISFIKRHGAVLFAKCLFCKAYFRLLRQVYGFDVWHATGAYPCRPYKRRVVELASSLNPGVVVEIGCGLGEILDRIPARRRFGFDVDPGVLAAAKKISRHHPTYDEASLLDAGKIAHQLAGEDVDVLIIVNWPHGMSIDALEAALSGLTREIRIRHLIIDTIRPGAMPEALHWHTLNDLERLGVGLRQVDGGDDVRDLHLLKLFELRTA